MTLIRSNVVEVIVFRRRGERLEFLLLKRSMEERPYPGMWQVVSGGRRKGETTLRTVLREVREETGLKPVSIWSLPFVNTFFAPSSDSLQAAPTFAAEVSKDSKVRLSAEHAEARWVTFGAARGLIAWPSHTTMLTLVRESIVPGKAWARHTKLL